MNILALDVYPSNVRAAVLDTETGRARGGIARAEVAIDAPVPDASEIPVPRLWEAVASCARQAVRQSGVAGQPGQDVAAVGLTTFLPGLVLLGKDDQPLAPIWTPWDRRARPAARQVWAHVGEEFLAATGHRPVPGNVSALAWRQQLTIDPYLSHRVHSYLHVNGWLAFHMTGVKAFDPGNASCSGLFGTLTDGQWSPRWCDYFEIDRNWLPPIVCGSATVGALRATAAAELGVPAGVPVKLGTGNLASRILATRMQIGDLMCVGGADTLAILTEHPVPAPRRLTQRLGVGRRFIHVAQNPLDAAALRWIHHLCFRDQSEEKFYMESVPAARERSTRVCLDPPFLDGDLFGIEAQRAVFRELEMTVDRLDLLAALLDAMTRRHSEAVANLGVGAEFRKLFLVGGPVCVFGYQFPEHQAGEIVTLDAELAPLQGVARLFATDGIE